MRPVTSLVHPELFIEQRCGATLSEVFLSAFLRKTFYFPVVNYNFINDRESAVIRYAL